MIIATCDRYHKALPHGVSNSSLPPSGIGCGIIGIQCSYVMPVDIGDNYFLPLEIGQSVPATVDRSLLLSAAWIIVTLTLLHMEDITVSYCHKGYATVFFRYNLG